jgi:hypothetical protein
MNINNNKTILSSMKISKDNLQTWSSKDAAVYTFGMRPIISSREYYDNILRYLNDIVLKDSQNIIEFQKNTYSPINNEGDEPTNSTLQILKIDILNKLNSIMANSTDEVSIFRDYNPLKEGFVITDIDIKSYKSINNNNYYYHTFIFGATNTTRYNTITFKGSVYQYVSNLNILDINNKQQSIIYINNLEFNNDYYSESNIIAKETYSSLPGYSLNYVEYKGPDNYETLVKELEGYY